MEHIFYTAVVYSFSNYNGDTLEKVDGGVDSIWKTIEEGIEEIDSEIDRLRNGFNRREGFIHHLIDSKLSTECENRTECFYTYRVNYGYGNYSIVKIELQSIHSKHVHL